MSYNPTTFTQWKALTDDQRDTRLNAEVDSAWIVPPSKFPRIETGKGPLSGLVFAAKDNIDVEGVPTTAGCSEYAYTPEVSSQAVQRLIAAGAVPVGKANLDQFATGLVGTRSPFGVVKNVHNENYISGGSSSGSAALVASGIVPFALGTDTAGSGRVPAGLQGVVGLKPTRGWISCRGVVPACRSLDCVSVFAATVGDAALVASVLGGYDPEDGYSRQKPPVETTLPTRKLAIPATLDWFGDELQAPAWEATLARWRAMGYELVPIDTAPLFAMAALLYEGPWVAERVAALTGFFPDKAAVMNPVVRKILEGASKFDAASVFRAEDKRRELLSVVNHLWDGCDALLVPTVPRHYTVDEVQADPIATNSKLGTWTNFVNLADLCALSVPAGTRADGLPFGITLIGRAWQDYDLAALGREWESGSDEVKVAVVGAHLSGLPLNHLLTKRGGRLIRAGKTAPLYRLFALEDQTPPKPGLIRVAQGGGSIALEVWSLPRSAYGTFVAEIPPPLGIGTLELDDGTRVQGFLCEAWTTEGRRDITESGGWRAWLASRTPQ